MEEDPDEEATAEAPDENEAGADEYYSPTIVPEAEAPDEEATAEAPDEDCRPGKKARRDPYLRFDAAAAGAGPKEEEAAAGGDLAAQDVAALCDVDFLRSEKRAVTSRIAKHFCIRTSKAMKSLCHEPRFMAQRFHHF